MEPTKPTAPAPAIHIVLAHSYLAYFVFSLLGLFADTLFHFNTPIKHGDAVMIALFALGSLLIWWAQRTSSLKSDKPYFERGPYRYMRNPTHIGILFLVSGYAAISGSAIFLGVTLIGYLISNGFFKKYESILHREYGSAYTEYKESVPKIL